MSATNTLNSGVTLVSFSFAFKWTLKAEKLNDIYKGSRSVALRSDLYQFKTVKDFRFYLEIVLISSHFGFTESSIQVKGSDMWSFEITYAFLVSKDRAYTLKESNHLSFLEGFHYSYVSNDEDVTIHCVVNAFPAYSASSAKEENLNLMKDLNTIDFDATRDTTFPSNYSNETVIDFIRKGVIPKFTIDIAIKIISETEKHKCEALKILSTEYLIKNISKESIKKISRAALEFGLPVLERKCMQKIAYGTILTK